MSLQPEGEELRKAIRWINEERMDDPGRAVARLVEKASLKFDLSPKEAAYLQRFFITQKSD